MVISEQENLEKEHYFWGDEEEGIKQIIRDESTTVCVSYQASSLLFNIKLAEKNSVFWCPVTDNFGLMIM